MQLTPKQIADDIIRGNHDPSLISPQVLALAEGYEQVLSDSAAVCHGGIVIQVLKNMIKEYRQEGPRVKPMVWREEIASTLESLLRLTGNL